MSVLKCNHIHNYIFSWTLGIVLGIVLPAPSHIVRRPFAFRLTAHITGRMLNSINSFPSVWLSLNSTEYLLRVPEVIPVPTVSLTIVDSPKLEKTQQMSICLCIKHGRIHKQFFYNCSFPFTLKCATNMCELSLVLVEENFLDLPIPNKNNYMSIIDQPALQCMAVVDHTKGS